MMISLMQATDLISRVIEFIRSILSRVFGALRGLLGAGTDTPPTPPPTPPEPIPVIIEPEITALITLFRVVVLVLVVLIVIFVFIILYQDHCDKKCKKEAFSTVEGRGNVEKIAQNESENTREVQE